MPRGYKGSKLHMQDAVADRLAELDNSIADALPALRGRALTWVSPLRTDDYDEYYDGDFLDALGLDAHKSALADFWPLGGPHWDALATVEGGGVVLVEAKARVHEARNPDRSGATAASSVARIAASTARSRAFFGVPPSSPSWAEQHYQVANRLAHLWWLHRERGVPTWLVFLGFTDSPDWPRDKLTPPKWRMQISEVFSKLGVPTDHPLKERIGVAVMKA
jgi:hypothetical protein